LRTQLESGQTVEIITAAGAHPNPRWVNFVTTAKARSSIRQYLKNLRFGDARELGRRLLEQSLRDAGTSLRKISRETTAAVLEELGLNNTNELFEQLGLGERLAPLVAKALLENPQAGTPADTARRTPIVIAGTEGMVVSYGRCCHPLPGDAIMGYLSAGRGVVIHRNVCGNLGEFRKQPHKWIAVNWEKRIDREFSVEIRVEVTNRPGALAEIAAKIGDADCNIEQVSVEEREEDTADLRFSILVKDRVHLARVIRSIRHMAVVRRVTRTCT
jgi:(p)ppGpp synthase/HD superfamily hydrolase